MEISLKKYLGLCNIVMQSNTSEPIHLHTDVSFSAAHLSEPVIATFQDIIYTHYQYHPRRFPWRETFNPYHILVSEVMLQQTQADRALTKYQEFIATFPSFQSLADASFDRILNIWQGLGYNRRARALKTIAEQVIAENNGVLPDSVEQLQQLPGIGPYTAAAICAFAFNQPVVLIETNIQSVYLHFFFKGETHISDTELVPLIKQTLHYSNPREWYYALMDYGAMLKKRHKNPSRRSKQYHKQTKFQGSDRQLRGAVLHLLLKTPGLTSSQISLKLQENEQRITPLLLQLQKEKLICKQKNTFYIAA